ncbi:MAG: hypothetical protein Q9208_006007 [Pyrenodesmia sp. 3 TL-2023]
MYGVYRPDDGQPFVLPSVRLAKQRIFNNNNNDETPWHHEYPPSHLGTVGFRQETADLIFGRGRGKR